MAKIGFIVLSFIWRSLYASWVPCERFDEKFSLQRAPRWQ